MTRQVDAVVMGLSPTGLYALRELGRAGLSVAAVGERYQTAAASRYVSHLIIEADPTRRLDRLISECGNADRKPVLVPSSDQDIDLIVENGPRLAEHFAFQSSFSDGLANKILTKESFYQLCEAEGVAYPGLWTGTAQELETLAPEISYPCMIKPSRIHEIKAQMAGKKGWIVRDPSELPQTMRQIPAEAGILICQEIVPGPDSAITLFCAYFDGEGGVHQPFTARKLRQYPPGFGSAATVQSSDETESHEIACKLLNGIGYEGIAAAEFKRDPRSGMLKIIEINPRPSLWFSVSGPAGKCVTLAAYCYLSGRMPPPAERPQINGVRWRYLGKDLYSALFYRLARRFVLPQPDMSAVGPPTSHIAPVYERDDPRPAFTEVGGLLRKGFGRLLRKLNVGR